jgi:uncharacterized protein YjbI with pentapeptide repeats
LGAREPRTRIIGLHHRNLPGEWLEENVQGVRLIPTSLAAWRSPSVEAIQMPWSGWATPHEWLVAGNVDYVTRRPKSLWSNVIVLPEFDIGTDGKNSGSTASISLRGRRLEGAVFLGAQLRKADFTGAELSGAVFDSGDLREAKFDCDYAGSDRKCTQLQGASLNLAQLQGASLDGAQLQGADLKGARLPGASLHGAQLQIAVLWDANLQGASLHGANLQGAYLAGAPLQGADLERAQLQGADLYQAQLQGASLNHVFVWRTKPPTRGQVEGALIERPRLEPKYRRLDCTRDVDVIELREHGPRVSEDFDGECEWSDESYATLKSIAEAALEYKEHGSALGQVKRSLALQRVEQLGQKPYEEDSASANVWRDFAAESIQSAETYPEGLAKRLISIGCAIDGAPYVIGGLIRQLYLYDRLRDNPAQKAEVARAFLNETNCAGARGLSEENKAWLPQMCGPEAPQPSPGNASR